MPMARCKNHNVSVDFDGRTYSVGTVFVEVPEGVIAKLRQHLPDELELLHKPPPPPIAPPSKKFTE